MTDTTANNLTLARFEDLLDRYGGDLTRWPAPERAAAEAFLATSPPARQLHSQAASLEQHLAGFVTPEPSPSLRRRLLADFAAQQEQASWLERLWRQLGGPRVAMPAMATALALGVAVGNWLPPPVDAASDTSSDDVLALLQYDLDDDSEW